MEFSAFDARHYPVVDVRAGYAEWVGTYEDTVHDEMDLGLLRRVRAVSWPGVDGAADLACGTGRTGRWLAEQGVSRIDGLDLTPEMLAGARERAVYDTLVVADMRATPLPGDRYDLAVEVLACEHIPDLVPLYREAARIVRPGGHFIVVGYHPHFLLNGIPTHFNRADGDPVAIEVYVHLLSDHVKAAMAEGFGLAEMDERVLDEGFIAAKPKWAKYRNRPVSFCMVWATAAGTR